MRLFLLFAALLIACGCDDGRLDTYPVTGKIVFEDGGSPRFGDIEFFEPNQKINARGKISREGTFSVGTYESDDGAVVGEHKVVIFQRTRNHFAAQIKDAIVHDHGDLIDEDYYDYRTSDLLVTVDPVEKNEVVLTVKRMPKREAKDSD